LAVCLRNVKYWMCLGLKQTHAVLHAVPAGLTRSAHGTACHAIWSVKCTAWTHTQNLCIIL